MDDLVERLRNQDGCYRGLVHNPLGLVGLTLEAADRIEALQAEVARLRLLAAQYRDDLRHPPASDSKERRLEAINLVLGDIA